MENKQKKSVGTIALVILLLIVTIVSIILATYAWAKYTSSASSNASAPVAKWDVSFTPDNTTFVGTYSHVVTGKIAPGTSGTFTVTPDPGDTEVCFTYTITMDGIQFLGANDAVLPDSTVIDDNGTANDSTDDITLADLKSHIRITNGSNVDVTNGASTSGSYDLGSHNSTTGAAMTPSGAQTFTWTWPYEDATLRAAVTSAQTALDNNNDDSQTASLTAALETAKSNLAAYDKIDTAAGIYSATLQNGLKMKVNYTATATQVEPTAVQQSQP